MSRRRQCPYFAKTPRLSAPGSTEPLLSLSRRNSAGGLVSLHWSEVERKSSLASDRAPSYPFFEVPEAPQALKPL